MELKLLPLEQDTLLRLQGVGELSWLHLSDTGDPLENLLGPQCYGRKVLLNMEQVQTIDTGGVCWLLRLDKRFRSAAGKLVLYRMPPLVRDVLEVLHLTPLLCIAEDEPSARALASAG
jgi:anti-anti-sigma regulatory factor